MCTDFVNITTENLASEHLCCIIRSKKDHPGVEAKKQWLSKRLEEGHVFRKLKEKAMEKHLWNTVWRMPKKRGNPVFVC